MVLPLPIAAGTREDAVRFVSLEHQPRMCEELDALFRSPRGGLKSRSIGSTPSTRPLVVHQVGAFIASYVPTRADFARLDPRFRVADVLFDSVPHYIDYGFAVFQLDAGEHRIHPMALTFPTRDPRRLFVPTVHLHDGRFHARAKFDHRLYYQRHRRTEEEQPADSYDDSVDQAMSSLDWVSDRPAESYEGLTAAGEPVVRRDLHGQLLNRDTWIDATT